MFEPLDKKSFAELEKSILSFWETNKIFLKSLEQRKNSNVFTIYDGPPFATGLPHYGHLLAGTIKDVIPRYKTMKGYFVPRRFGWDTHGLPIENEIEKEHNLSGAISIEEFGIARFNEECRAIVLRYTEEWRKTVTRMGRWVDFSQTWHTMDKTYMETVWWVFKELYDKGLIYEGYKVMPFSAKLGTPLSNFEATSNYKDVDDPSLTVAFTLRDDPSTELLIWTTTPWTLPSNLATAVGPTIDYVTIRDNKSYKQYILAKDRLSNYYKSEEAYEIIKTQKGKDLEGLTYYPPFQYFENHFEKGAFRILCADYVSTQDGTGIVHTAPGFGEDDFYICQKAGIELVCPVDNNGNFTEEVTDFAGCYVKDADKGIIKVLREQGKVIHLGTIHHRYPYCWRSDTPLIYKVLSTWFVAVEKIKEQLLASNAKIHWVPEHIKEGRFGKWLEGARDWAISRNRYWGTPIPLWRAEDGSTLAIGSIEELKSFSGQCPDDLHRHYLDHITIHKDGKEYRRIPEVFDCWFESGSMPYAQNHYPFENKAFTEENFPADFIAEGLDQTRGWFYTLTVLSTALFQQPAFKHCIVNGIILAEDGNKMSKRLRNYPAPEIVIEKYGADAIRLYMLHSPVVRAEDLRFSEKGVELLLRQVLIPWWNAYSFFITYARIYKWQEEENRGHSPQTIDRWILSVLNRLIHEVEEGMDAYDLSAAVEPLIGFVDQLCNWYIRRSRRRFWEEKASDDRYYAFQTLYTVLLSLCKIGAPFVPFISESIYTNLRKDTMPESVHLCDYPVYEPSCRDLELEASMKAVQQVVSLGHTLRKENKLKVRQPLPGVHIVSSDSDFIHFLDQQQHLVADELNVKEVHLHRNEDHFVTLEAKPQFRVLGKKVGKRMQDVQAKIAQLDKNELKLLMTGHSITLNIAGEDIVIDSTDVEVHRKVREGMIAINEGTTTLVLDTTLDDNLIREGLAREIVNKINTMRRDAELEVSDRIRVRIQSTHQVKECYLKHSTYINNEILAVDVSFGSCHGNEWDLNGESAIIEIEKV